jgi:hypothetical protein
MRRMTGLDEAKRPASRSPAGLLTRPLRPYAEIFTIPGAWRFSVAGVIGRMPMSMFGLGTVLLISAVTGKYGVAGTVSAVGSLGYAFTSPRVARAVDSHGQRRVLIPLLTVFTVADRAAHRGGRTSSAHLGILPTGGGRGIGHAVAGRDGQDALERPARGLAPAAHRVLLRVGR